jgi:hypothetical protein
MRNKRMFHRIPAFPREPAREKKFISRSVLFKAALLRMVAFAFRVAPRLVDTLLEQPWREMPTTPKASHCAAQEYPKLCSRNTRTFAGVIRRRKKLLYKIASLHC